jgi:hypothetical protein
LVNNDAPKICDLDLKIVETKNIDYWLKSKTDFSYEQIALMADAYNDGLNNSYSLSDIKLISSAMIKATKDAIFKTDLVDEFASSYWIELMDANKLNKFIDMLRIGFDDLLHKHGEDELYNILCRLWQFSNVCHYEKMYVFESMIKNRMNRIPKLPAYPNTDDAEKVIQEMVFGILFDRYNEHRNVPDSLVLAVKRADSNEQKV